MVNGNGAFMGLNPTWSVMIHDFFPSRRAVLKIIKEYILYIYTSKVFYHTYLIFQIFIKDSHISNFHFTCN